MTDDCDRCRHLCDDHKKEELNDKAEEVKHEKVLLEYAERIVSAWEKFCGVER